MADICARMKARVVFTKIIALVPGTYNKIYYCVNKGKRDRGITWENEDWGGGQRGKDVVDHQSDNPDKRDHIVRKRAAPLVDNHK